MEAAATPGYRVAMVLTHGQVLSLRALSLSTQNTTLNRAGARWKDQCDGPQVYPGHPLGPFPLDHLSFGQYPSTEGSRCSAV